MRGQFPHLRKGNRTGKKFDQVAGLEDDVRIIGLARRLYGHGTLYQVERRIDSMWREGRDHVSPDFSEIVLAVFGKQSGEGRFFEERLLGPCSRWIERRDGPLSVRSRAVSRRPLSSACK
jgi:hypothetical protein